MRHRVDLSTAEGEPVVGELLVAGSGFAGSRRASRPASSLSRMPAAGPVAPRGDGHPGYAHVMVYGVIVVPALQEPASARLASALVQALGPSAAETR